ncbi:Hypothetical protein NTJ_15964 [Nesidiocoris tenuis]|uniref:Uncharacterized protein n=1 Tax=Nesidiocoris tenuis TaxID=355587 RepID=A0ABN7BFJ7_9HEMI|nr:Hypothetical protein NTJ_15964 [Nesidiocoris tenuis]
MWKYCAPFTHRLLPVSARPNNRPSGTITPRTIERPAPAERKQRRARTSASCIRKSAASDFASLNPFVCLFVATFGNAFAAPLTNCQFTAFGPSCQVTFADADT